MDVSIAGETVPLQAALVAGIFLLSTSILGGCYLARVIGHVRRTGGWVSVAEVIPGDIAGAALIGNFYMLMAVAQFFSSQSSDGGGSSASTAPSSGMILVNLLMFLALYLFMGGILAFSMKKRGTSLRKFLGFDKSPLWARAGKGLLVLLAAMPLMWAVGILWQVLLTDVFHMKLTMQDPVKMMLEIDEPAGILCMVLMAVIVAPIGEELAFRGYLYPVVKRYGGRWPALLGTGILFGLVHGNWAAGLALAFLGCVLALAYEHTGSLITPILMHITFNGLNVALLFITTSAAKHVPTPPDPAPLPIPEAAPAGMLPLPPGMEHALRQLLRVD